MQRELQRADIRTLQALQQEINRQKEADEGDGIRIELSGKKFVMMPLHRKVRFKGETWAVDCPTEYKAGSASRTYVSGEQGDFEIDMMLLKFHLNVADNSGF
jgi:hypothetical protein